MPELHDQISEILKSHPAEIQGLISVARPFGPHDMEKIHSPALFELLYDDLVSPIQHLPDERSLFILGRRGSGKTSLLNRVLTQTNTLVISFESSEIFKKVTDVLILVHSQDPEIISEIWAHVSWIGTITEIEKRVQNDDLNSFTSALKIRVASTIVEPSVDDLVLCYLTYVCSLVTQGAMSLTVRTMLESVSLGGVSFSLARQTTIAILKAKTWKVAVLIDSLERLTVDFGKHEFALQGLLRYVGSLANSNYSHLSVRCCFPTEMYSEFRSLSSNSLKDLRATERIEWKSRGIIVLAARRFWKFANIFHMANPQLAYRINPALLKEPDDFKSATLYLQVILPSTVKNRLVPNSVESALAYAMRHTQLLPRQFILLLEAIVAQAGADNLLMNRVITQGEITAGVNKCEKELWQEVASAHKAKYRPSEPQAIEKLVQAICKELPLMFNRDTFSRVFGEVSKAVRHQIDDEQAFDLLVAMGTIGVERADLSTDFYTYSEFSYTIGELDPPKNANLCLHPLFSEIGGARTNPGCLPIFPIGSDFER
jgi:hypothetical protein